jgi:hypothetical protein
MWRMALFFDTQEDITEMAQDARILVSYKFFRFIKAFYTFKYGFKNVANEHTNSPQMWRT